MRQLGVYLLVGVFVFTLELGSFSLMRHAGLSLTVSNVLARSLGGLAGFCGNRAFTFARTSEQRGKVLVEALRYASLFALLTTLSTGLLHIATSVLGSTEAGLLETTVKFVVDVFVVATGFVCQRLWVFRAPSEN